jgi:hypothetical protein
MERRYTALRVIGTIYKIIGVIVGVLTILAALAICASFFLGGVSLRDLRPEMGAPFMPGPIVGGAAGVLVAGALAILYGGGLAITLYGFGEGIYLLLALEENTRMTSQALQRQFER